MHRVVILIAGKHCIIIWNNIDRKDEEAVVFVAIANADALGYGTI